MGMQVIRAVGAVVIAAGLMVLLGVAAAMALVSVDLIRQGRPFAAFIAAFSSVALAGVALMELGAALRAKDAPDDYVRDEGMAQRCLPRG